MAQTAACDAKRVQRRWAVWDTWSRRKVTRDQLSSRFDVLGSYWDDEQERSAPPLPVTLAWSTCPGFVDASTSLLTWKLKDEEEGCTGSLLFGAGIQSDAGLVGSAALRDHECDKPSTPMPCQWKTLPGLVDLTTWKLEHEFCVYVWSLESEVTTGALLVGTGFNADAAFVNCVIINGRGPTDVDRPPLFAGNFKADAGLVGCVVLNDRRLAGRDGASGDDTQRTDSLSQQMMMTSSLPDEVETWDHWLPYLAALVDGPKRTSPPILWRMMPDGADEPHTFAAEKVRIRRVLVADATTFQWKTYPHFVNPADSVTTWLPEFGKDHTTCGWPWLFR